VIEHLDNLDIALVGQRQDDIARPKARVNPTIDGRDPNQLGEAFGSRAEAVVFGGIDDVVNSHAFHRGTGSRVLLTTQD
jgi:hypothetical protein